jgi:lipopolysaccharide transport system ATP-binding protein
MSILMKSDSSKGRSSEARTIDEANAAVLFENVSKVYTLQGERVGFLGGEDKNATQMRGRKVQALSNISFTIEKGARVGLIGRNGAGKTTLLKMIAGNHKPTSGRVLVDGAVQALMTVGYGFHFEQSGMQNIKNNLKYNGLSKEQMQAAIEDIVDFCELGPYIYEPFKTYSMGMQARVMFAAATAINPELLIVDEILGAGDAYFTAKSKHRVQKMVGNGCTMLLVSHSMAQVLEMCESAIWLEKGKIVMAGDALTVVKAYEEKVSNSIARLEDREEARESNRFEGQTRTASANKVTFAPAPRNGAALQNPFYIPHAKPMPAIAVENSGRENFESLARGGLSRWEGSGEITISGFAVRPSLNEERSTIAALKPAVFTFFLKIHKDGDYRCTYGLAIHDMAGKAMSRLWSPTDVFTAKAGDYRRVDMSLNPCQIGAGEYTVGISIHEESPLEMIGSAKRYDLLGRSFELHVELSSSLNAIESSFFHTSEWDFKSAT